MQVYYCHIEIKTNRKPKGDKMSIESESIQLLQEQVRDLQEKVSKQNSQIIKDGKSINNLKDKTRFIDESKMYKSFKNAETRISELAQKVQIEITKNCVVSEVSNIYPDLALDVVRLMSQPDVFFLEYQNLTLRDWADLAKKMAP